jgi:hypothetical protein
MSVRFYATGSFQNLIGDMVNVHKSTACRAIRRVSLALVRTMEEHIYFPVTNQDTIRTKQDFLHMANFPNVIACVDCTHCRIVAPADHEHEYVNRKGFHSINVQIMCDANMRIVNIVVQWPGSTHDARILRQSNVYQGFENGEVNGLVLGDSAYPLKPWLMTPILIPRTELERRYNHAHTHTRCIVERCIGLAKRRFYCLGSILRLSPERACTVITACLILHNFCLRKGIPAPDEGEDDEDQENDDNEPQNGLNDNVGGRVARARLIAQHFAQN